MSEQEKPKSSFMEELEQWARAEVIDPLLYAGANSAEKDDFDYEPIVEKSLRALKAKVLQSYRNGQAAGPRQPQKQWQRQREFQR
jgi:hypothetical protein